MSDRRRVPGVVLASVTAALAVLLVTVIAARRLSVADNAEFLVFWSLLFGVFGLVVGLQNESTRAVGSLRRSQGRERDEGAVQVAPGVPATPGVPVSPGVPVVPGARIRDVALVLGAVTALLVGVTGVWWAPALAPSTSPVVVLLVVVGVLLYSLFCALLGSFAGLGDWFGYAVLLTSDNCARLALVVLAVVAGFGLLGIEWASAVASAVIGLVLLVPRFRPAWSARADAPMAAMLRKGALAMVSSTATAVLITAFPVLIRLTSRDVAPDRLAAMILAVSLTRTPILMPLQALQGMLIGRFLDAGQRVGRALLAPFLAIVALAVVGAGLAAVVGPPVVRLAYGEAYDSSGSTFAVLVLAGGSLAVLTLTGTATIASNRHRTYSAGWVAGALCSSALLFLPFGLTPRVSLALAIGPLLGALVHTLGLRRTVPSREGQSVAVS